MRTLKWKAILVAGILALSLGLFTVAVRADGGGGPFNPHDGRVNPMTGDRVAVYLHDDSIDVWGLDALNNGVSLTTFTLKELTSESTFSHQTPMGTVTLRFISHPIWHVGFSDNTATSFTTILDQSAVYSVTWSGGPLGAKGTGGYVKTFNATYILK